MRRLFLTAAEDHVIISIDFSQEELMIMAVESQDPMMLSCYLGDNKKDIHSLTGSGFAGVPYEEFVEVLKDENNPLMKEYKAARTRAKPFNFGIGYGAVAATVARNEKMEFEVAKKLFEAWLQTYANIKPWQDNCLRMATRLGYVKTALGNRRHIDDRVLSGEEWQKQRAGRQAANSIIQGTGADILKIVMTEMHRKEVFKLTGAIPVVPLYDEIVASVPRHTAYEYGPLRAHCWPQDVQVETKSWGDLQFPLNGCPAGEDAQSYKDRRQPEGGDRHAIEVSGFHQHTAQIEPEPDSGKQVYP